MIQILEDRIRYLLFTEIRPSTLLRDIEKRNKLWSSLNLLGDTQSAIEAYTQFHNVKNRGTIYLIIYGILQTLQLQQDAVQNIADITQHPVRISQILSNIRIVRNNIAGHPTRSKENGLLKSTSIFRNTISTTNIQFMTTYSSDKEDETGNICIPSLIECQQTHLNKILEEIIIKLETQKMEHYEEYKNEKLIDIFNLVDDQATRLLQSTNQQDQIAEIGGGASLEFIAKSVANFKTALNDRDERVLLEDGHFKLVDHAIQELRKYFDGHNDMNSNNARIFAAFVSEQIKELKRSATELDQLYESASLRREQCIIK